MNRRNAIQRTLLLFGGVLSAPTLAAMQKWDSKSVFVNQGFSFSLSENKVLIALVDTILPKTTSPSASEADVPDFIEMMLSDCYQANEQEIFKKGLSEVSDSFIVSEEALRNKILSNMEESSMTYLSKNPRNTTFWRMLKELTLLGYFSSEIGMTQAMEYVSVPAKFELIKLKKGQKTYSEYLAR